MILLLSACGETRRNGDIENSDDSLPLKYFLIGPSGARPVGERDAPMLAPGFAVAIVEERQSEGRRIGRTRHGRWLPMSALSPVEPLRFHGETIKDAKLDFGWVVEERAPLWPKPPIPSGEPSRKARKEGPGETIRATETAALFERVQVIERRDGWIKIANNRWLRDGDVRIPRAVPRPAAVGPRERWIDIELSTQTLVAYEGDRPVFATLVSTGVGAPGTPISTPRGIHRLRAKQRFATMDNLEHAGVSYYSVEDVPWVMWFTERAALHAAFWHKRFGHLRSHGCVNLAPADARRLFASTAPRLPEGRDVIWSKNGEGTVVQVR